MEYIIYTDGALRNYRQQNWRIGAWCYYIRGPFQADIKAQIEYNNSKNPITNNRMELTAIIESLMALNKNDPNIKVTIYTDSQYCLYGVKTHKHKTNQDLWARYEKLINTYKMDLTYVHVYGHQGNFGNELVDKTMRDMLDNNDELKNHKKNSKLF